MLTNCDSMPANYDTAAIPLQPSPAVPAPSRQGPGASLRPLAIDVGLPLGTYYLLHSGLGLGLSLWLSLALSSVVPVVRTIGGMATRHELNTLAALMLAVNIAGIVVNFITGDPRMMIAKDSVVSSVIGIAILISVAARRPLMTAGLKPYLTRGSAERTAAWDRLLVASTKFKRLELLFSAIWGTALLAECVARLVGAFALPVTTMVWLGTVLTLGAIGLAILVGGVAAGPMEQMIRAELADS